MQVFDKDWTREWEREKRDQPNDQHAMLKGTTRIKAATKLLQTAGSSNGKLRLRCQIDRPFNNLFVVARQQQQKDFFIKINCIYELALKIV